MPGAESCRRLEGCAPTLPKRGEGTGKTASSLSRASLGTGFAHVAFVHSSARAAGSSDAVRDMPRGSRGGAEMAGKGAADVRGSLFCTWRPSSG